MDKHGVVEVSNYGLHLRCSVCCKTLAYQLGSGMTMTAWDKLKRDWTKLHNDKCKGE